MTLGPILQSLVILTLANTAPLIAKKVLGALFSCPVDCGLTFFDKRSLFGPSKTVRGVVVSILAAAAVAPVIGVGPAVAAWMATAAMAGDLLASFTKRRLNMPPSSQAPVLDQVPESLLPLLAGRQALLLTSLDIIVVLAIFFIGELIFARLFYRLGLRDQPY